jgi:5'-3' exonuclease
MGIRGLERIIKKYENDTYEKRSVKQISLNEFRGKYVCIDTSEFIVRSLIKDKNYHVSGILNLLEKCFKYNITPCFVFDGKPPKEKTLILNERYKKKNYAQQKIEELNKEKTEILEINDLLAKLNIIQKSKQNSQLNSLESSRCNSNSDDIELEIDININEKEIKKEIISRISSSGNLMELSLNSYLTDSNSCSEYNSDCEDVFQDVFQDDSLANSISETIESKLLFITNEKKKLKKKCHSFNDNHIKDIQYLLDLLRVPYINSKCESDIICASLCKLGIVDAVISNDMDFIILGSPLVIRNINFRSDEIDIYDYNNILNNLNLTQEKLVELSLLLGCDYCQRVVNINNKYVYDIFKLFDNLEHLIQNLCFNSNVSNTNLDFSNLDSDNLDVSNLDSDNLDVANVSDTNLDVSNLDSDNLDSDNLDSDNLDETNEEYIEYIKNKNILIDKLETSNEIKEYLRSDIFNKDENININKIKNLFLIDIDKKTLYNMIIYNINYGKLEEQFMVCNNYLLNIKNSKKLYNEILQYCISKCFKLNDNLIFKKLSIICKIPPNLKYFNYPNSDNCNTTDKYCASDKYNTSNKYITSSKYNNTDSYNSQYNFNKNVNYRNINYFKSNTYKEIITDIKSKYKSNITHNNNELIC